MAGLGRLFICLIHTDLTVCSIHPSLMQGGELIKALEEKKQKNSKFEKNQM